MSAPKALCSEPSPPGTRRESQAPPAPDTPTTSPTAGVTTTRPDSCLPPLSSDRRGFDRVPWVSAVVTSTGPAFHRIWTPVSHRKPLMSGSPGPGAGFPTGKLERHPRPRIHSTSSADAGAASLRSDVRYWYARGYPMTGLSVLYARLPNAPNVGGMRPAWISMLRLRHGRTRA
jgi:hypothetical protein